MSAVIEAEGLVKNYGRVRALDGLDLNVAAGQVHGFLGPNGAGKTTTLRILLGLLRASGGRVALWGRDPWGDSTELHRRLAYDPGDVTLWPNRSGGEVIDLLGRLRGGHEQARRDDLIEFGADRAGGDRVVPSDHADLDAGGLGDPDGLQRRRTKRVDDAHHSHEPELLDVTHRVGLHGLLEPVQLTEPEGERPQTLLGHPAVGLQELLAGLLDRHLRAVPQLHVAAPIEDDVGAAFDQPEEPGAAATALQGHVVIGDHELVVGVEGNLGEPRVGPAGLLGVHAEAASTTRAASVGSPTTSP